MYPADAKAMARCPPLLARFGPLAQANKTHEIQTLRNRKTSFGDKASSLDWNLISVHLPDIPFQHPGGVWGHQLMVFRGLRRFLQDMAQLCVKAKDPAKMKDQEDMIWFPQGIAFFTVPASLIW